MRRMWISVLLSLGASALGAALALAGPLSATEAAAQDGNPSHPQAHPQAQQGGEEPAELSPEDQARRARVVAKVGAVEITVGELEDAVNRQSPILRARYRDRAALESLLQDMVRFELLAREAEREHFGDDSEVTKALHQNAVQQMIRHDFDERITVESIPAADVHTYYDAHQEEFSREEMRRAAHIQVASREEAARILAQAREGDARTFRNLAREHSLEHATKLRGGDLRYFNTEGHAANSRDPRIAEQIVRAAFALRNRGDIAPEPVEIEGHFSVVQLTGIRPAEHRSFEQAEATIRLRLWRERRQAAIDELVEGLRREHVRELHEDRLRAIRLEPPERLSKRGPAGGPAGPRGSRAREVPAGQRGAGEGARESSSEEESEEGEDADEGAEEES